MHTPVIMNYDLQECFTVPVEYYNHHTWTPTTSLINCFYIKFTKTTLTNARTHERARAHTPASRVVPEQRGFLFLHNVLEVTFACRAVPAQQPGKVVARV